MKSFFLTCVAGIAAATNVSQYGQNFFGQQTNQLDHSHDHDHPENDEKIEEVQAEILTLKTDLGDVETNCDDQVDRLIALQGQIDSINGWTAPLQMQSTSNTSSIGIIEAAIPALEKELDALESDQMDEKIKIAVLEMEVGTVINAKTLEDLEALEALVQAQLTAIDDRVIVLESSMTTLGMNIETNNDAIVWLKSDISDLEDQASMIETAVQGFNDQKVLSDYFNVNSIAIIFPKDTAADLAAESYSHLSFCVEGGEFVELLATANIPIPEMSAGTYVSSMQLIMDGDVVAVDTKITQPSEDAKDRQFSIFYKTTALEAGSSFDLTLTYEFKMGEEAITIAEGNISIGYRIYGSGFPTTSELATFKEEAEEA